MGILLSRQSPPGLVFPYLRDVNALYYQDGPRADGYAYTCLQGDGQKHEGKCCESEAESTHRPKRSRARLGVKRGRPMSCLSLSDYPKIDFSLAA